MTQSDIAEYVREHPGVHFNELVEWFDITPETLIERAEQLESSDTLTRADLFGKTHFYPLTYDSWEQTAIALLRRETSREILVCVLEADGETPSAVADEVGIARSTLEWHVDRLIEGDLLSKNRDGWTVHLEATRPEETSRLLAEIQPSLPERWIDRTTRLFDHFVETEQ